jgi:nitroimidazol reductase NimA-like FMN-containing flavoprotein (pyridoxamine 5'-phosphate oxidase superfamily)
MNEKRTKDLIKQILSKQMIGVLATDINGQPYTSLVGYLASDDLRTLYFVTTRSTRKYGALSANPRVAMLIDSRSNRSEDFRDAAAVTVMGQAHEVDKPEYENIVREYVSKHPQLKDFIDSPTSALIRIDAETYYVVTRFQHVVVLHIDR